MLLNSHSLRHQDKASDDDDKLIIMMIMMMVLMILMIMMTVTIMMTVMIVMATLLQEGKVKTFRPESDFRFSHSQLAPRRDKIIYDGETK